MWYLNRLKLSKIIFFIYPFLNAFNVCKCGLPYFFVKKRNEKGIMAYLCCYGLFVHNHTHIHVSKLRILSSKKNKGVIMSIKGLILGVLSDFVLL